MFGTLSSLNVVLLRSRDARATMTRRKHNRPPKSTPTFIIKTEPAPTPHPHGTKIHSPPMRHNGSLGGITVNGNFLNVGRGFKRPSTCYSWKGLAAGKTRGIKLSFGIMTTSAVLKTLGWCPSLRQALYSFVTGRAICGQAACSILVVIPSEPGVVLPVCNTAFSTSLVEMVLANGISFGGLTAGRHPSAMSSDASRRSSFSFRRAMAFSTSVE